MPAQDPLNPPLSALVLAQRDMQGRILGDLRFMLHHFVQLQSARELGEEPAPAAPPVNRERLASFIGHLEQQIEKCLRPASKQSELDELEKHVTTTLLPVKAKLEQQLGNAAVANQAREAKRLQEQRATEKLALGRTPSPEHKVENIDATARPAKAPKAPKPPPKSPPRVARRRPAAARGAKRPVPRRGMPRDLSAPDLLNLEDAEGEAFGCLEYLEGDGVLGEPDSKRRKQVSASVVTDSSASSGKGSSSEDDIRGPVASPSRSKNRVSNRGSRAVLGEPARDLRFDHFDVRTVQQLPEVVEYSCSACAHAYTTTSHLNPWWSLARHACPRCGQVQFPWIDISSAANRIRHPPPAALDRAHAAARAAAAAAAAAARPPPALPKGAAPASKDGPLLAGETADTATAAGLCSATQGAQLLDLFAHARRCPGHHRDPRHAAVCANAKFVMLHARDCTSGSCPVPWCGAVRKLLRHMVRCPNGQTCNVCAAECRRTDAEPPRTDYWQALRQAGADDEAMRIVG